MKPKDTRSQWTRWAALFLIAFILGGCSNSQTAPTPTNPPSSSTSALAAPTSAPASPTPTAAPSAQDILNQALRAPHDTATSLDGKAELLIPKGALPPGVTADQIKITPLDASQVAVPSGLDPAQLAYQLEPNGLQFNTPALMHISLPAGSSSELPIALLKSGDQVSAIDNTYFGLDQASGQAMILASIPHFSEYLLAGKGLSLEIDDPGDQIIGPVFPVVATLGPTGGFSLVPVQTSDLHGEWTGSPNLGLGWNVKMEPIENTDYSKGLQDFYCRTPGEATVTLSMYVSISFNIEGEGTKIVHSWPSVTSKPFNCLAAPPPAVPPSVGQQPAPSASVSLQSNPFPSSGEVNTATSGSYSNTPPAEGPDPSLLHNVVDKAGTAPGAQAGNLSETNLYNSPSNTQAFPFVGEEATQYPTSSQAIEGVVALVDVLKSDLEGNDYPAVPIDFSTTPEVGFTGFYQNKFYAIDITHTDTVNYLAVVGGADPSQLPTLGIENAKSLAHNLDEYSAATRFLTITKVPSALVLVQELHTLLPATSGWVENSNIPLPTNPSIPPLAPGSQVSVKEDFKNPATGQEVTDFAIQFSGWQEESLWLAGYRDYFNWSKKYPSLQLETPKEGMQGEVYSGIVGDSAQAECDYLTLDPVTILSTARSTDASPAGLAQATILAESLCQSQMELILSSNRPVLPAYGSAPSPANPPATVPPAGPLKLRVTVLAHEANCRFGPNPGFGYDFGLRSGALMDAVGRNSDGTWLLIQPILGRENQAWISVSDQYGNAEVSVTGDIMSLPDESENLSLPTSPLVVGTSGSLTKGSGNTVTAKWGGVGVVNSKAQTDANASLYILQYSTVENGQKVVHTQATNETSFNITPTSSGFIRITDAKVYVQQAISPGVMAYAQSSLNLSALAP